MSIGTEGVNETMYVMPFCTLFRCFVTIGKIAKMPSVYIFSW